MRKGPISKCFESLWRTDYGLSALLLFPVLGMFVAPPGISVDLLSPWLIDLTFALMLRSGAATVAFRRPSSASSSRRS
ncbi:MAG: hypothetical protein ACRD3M_11400 [Thermoanaerobaculia bacterium]